MITTCFGFDVSYGVSFTKYEKSNGLEIIPYLLLEVGTILDMPSEICLSLQCHLISNFISYLLLPSTPLDVNP